MSAMSWLRQLRPKLHRRRPAPRHAQDHDYVRLGLTRLEDRVVLDAAGVVADLNPGTAGANPTELTPFNGAVYFAATGDNAAGQPVGRELYRLDGNGAVQLVADLKPGAGDANPGGFTLFNGSLIFAADGPQGRELYRVDANGNVALFADVNPGVGSSNPQDLTVFNNRLYISAEGNSGRELYVVNAGGNAALVADLRPGAASSNPSDFAIYGGNLFFAATDANGRGMYHMHTTGNLAPVEIDLGVGVSDPRGLIVYDGVLYFSAESRFDGRELFILHYDFTSYERVHQVANLDGTSASSSPSDFYVFQNALYFTATGANGRELFRVIDNHGPNPYVNHDSWWDDHWSLEGNELRQFDIASGNASSSPGSFTAFNNALYFAATVNGQRGLYRLDGDTVTAVTLPTGVALPSDVVLTPLSTGLYFAADGVTGREVYRLDAAGNAVLLADANLGAASSNPTEFLSYAGSVYFVGATPDAGRELLVLHSHASSLRVEHGTLIFRDDIGDKDNRLVVWSDGTRLHVRDQNGHAIALLTSLSGAAGIGSSEITIPLASLGGVNAFQINTRGGNDSVTFDFTSNATSYLARFTTTTFDGGANTAPGDRLRFVGDGVLNATYTPDALQTGSGVVVVGNTVSRSFYFRNLEPVDITGMAEARLVTPPTNSSADSLTIANGRDSLQQLVDALVVSGTVGGTQIESANFFGNNTVVIETGSGGDGRDRVVIASASNAHLNQHLRIHTGAFGNDEVLIAGATVLAGSLEIVTEQLAVNAAIRTGGTVLLDARGDIQFSSAGGITTANGNVSFIGDADNLLGGGIYLADGAVVNAGNATIWLHATDSIRLGRLVTTNATASAVRITSLTGAIVDGNLTSAAAIDANVAGAVVTLSAAQGVGTAANALNLAAASLVVLTGNSDQYLTEQDALQQLDLRAGTGTIVLTAAGAIHDPDNNVDVRAARWQVQATAVGSAAAPVQTNIDTLVATITQGDLHLLQTAGDLHVQQVQALGANAVVGIGVSHGDIELESIVASGASSLVMLQAPNGAIHDRNGAAQNIVAASAELSAAHGIGPTHALETTLSKLSAAGGDGGVFISNRGDLQIGGVNGPLGLVGLSAQQAPIDVHTSGTLKVIERVVTSGVGDITLDATRDLLLQAEVTNDYGAIELTALRHLIATLPGDVATMSGAINLAAGDTLTFAGDIGLGSGSVTFNVVGQANVLSGVVSGLGSLVKQGAGKLTLTTVSNNTYTGTTELLAGVLQVDGAIGYLNSAQRLTLAAGTTLSGSGNVNAPIYSLATSSSITSTGHLKLGDGSTSGFLFAGSLLVQAGHQVTLRDANLAELGVFTNLTGGGLLLAAGGVEVGGGETLLGSGAVSGQVLVLAGGTVSPGNGPGTLTTATGDVRLLPGAILVLQIDGLTPGAQHDQLQVLGNVSLAGAMLNLQGGLFRPALGTTFLLVNNDGSDPIAGRFVDANGVMLAEGATVRVGGIEAEISYVGGSGNDVVLTVRDRLTIIATPNTNTTSTPAFGRMVEQEIANLLQLRSSAPIVVYVSEPPPPLQEKSLADANAPVFEERTTERVRVYFRIVNGATNQDNPQEYELDPSVLRDVVGFFKRYRFQDNHYRVYLQEPGKKERLILDVPIVDGRIVPPDFRETEGQTAPAAGAPETARPPAPEAAPTTTNTQNKTSLATPAYEPLHSSSAPPEMSFGKIARMLRHARPR